MIARRTHVSLFTGIGGFDLACEWLGIETVLQCEIDHYCRKVLKKHWPNIRRIHDVRKVTYACYAETVAAKASTVLAHSQCERNIGISRIGNAKKEPVSSSRKEDAGIGKTGNGGAEQVSNPFLLTGGFPCQPFSCAGKRRGKEDDRFLWPEMLRVIKELQPHWVLGENVAGLIKMELDRVLTDLEGIGYACQPIVIPACGVGAPHQRKRVWIVGWNTNSVRCSRNGGSFGTLQNENSNSNRVCEYVANAASIMSSESAKRSGRESVGGGGCNSGRITEAGRVHKRSEVGCCNWAAEPCVGRVAHGIPGRVDRLKALGNAIVPQVAYEIIRSMILADETPIEL
jgi:DNA (cytosine-5)-methyltransferase 1